MTFTTYRQVFTRHAQKKPDSACLIVDGEPMTWSDLGRWTGRLASHLGKQEVAAGPKRAALLIDEPADFLGVFLGLIALGWVPVPIPDRLKNESLTALLDDCAPRLVIASPQHETELRNSCGSAAVVVTTALREAAERNLLIEPVAEHVPSPEDEMTIFYSSGTTSVPKGVVHTHRAQCASAALAIQRYHITDRERTLISAPIYTARALLPLLCTAYAGGTSIINQRFDVTRVLDCVRRYSPDTLDLVPTQFRMLIEDPRFDPAAFTGFRFILCGGAVLDPELSARLFELFPSNFIHVYGSTETGLISYLPRRAAPEKRGSVGLSQGVDLRILGEDDSVLDVGQRGEIVVFSPANLQRYVGASASRNIFWSDRGTGRAFYRTGDIGWQDADGYLWLSDRKKDMIITAGFKIYPVDIEAVLSSHPSVREAAVVGRPHNVLGETPVAFVTLKDGHHADDEARPQILRWVNGRLNANQRLQDLHIIQTMPNSPSGKPLKTTLKALAAQ